MDLEERRRRYRSSWQAQFSYAWVHAVASTVGVTCQLQYQDIDGVDVMLRGGHRWPALSIQVKTWTVPVERDGCFKYRLDHNDYDRLREPDHAMGISSILVLVVMPKSREEWLSVTDEGTLLRRRACWMYLAGMPPSRYQGDKVPVDMPTDRLFSAEALAAMMERIAGGGRP